MKHIKKFNESYSDETVKQIGIDFEIFRRYIKNLDYDSLIEYAELSQQFKTLDILEYLKKTSNFL
jgi:hypothetical protein